MEDQCQFISKLSLKRMKLLNAVMSGNQENILETIIKVEPQEFEEKSSDDVLRFKASIFSDPIVLLDKLSLKITTSLFPISAQNKNDISSTENVQISASKRIGQTSSQNPHACSICPKVLASRDTLKQHFESVHSRSTQMLCDLCPKFYFTRHSVSHHMRMVHSKKKFACNVCDFKTADKTKFQRHKTIHAAKVECPICEKQVSVLKVHMETHKPKVACPICQKPFPKQNLRIHMNQSHNKIKCQDCDEVLENKKKLRRHKLMKHYEGEIFKCDCGSVFTARQVLKNHQKRVHSTEKQTCDVCQKQFSSGETLKTHWKAKHLKTHGVLDIGSKRICSLNRSGPFICDKCGSKYQTRNTFFLHNYLHHWRTTIFCDLCPRSFSQKWFLKNHIEKVHLKLRPYQCKDCQYESFHKNNLKIHMKQHGSKTECNVCHKFVTNMREHLRGHVKAKCPICSKILSKLSLPRHLKTHKRYQ